MKSPVHPEIDMVKVPGGYRCPRSGAFVSDEDAKMFIQFESSARKREAALHPEEPQQRVQAISTLDVPTRPGQEPKTAEEPKVVQPVPMQVEPAPPADIEKEVMDESGESAPEGAEEVPEETTEVAEEVPEEVAEEVTEEAPEETPEEAAEEQEAEEPKAEESEEDDSKDEEETSEEASAEEDVDADEEKEIEEKSDE